jgi:NADH:ubiquinone oxidoreductase subunit 6 (subunit J)
MLFGDLASMFHFLVVAHGVATVALLAGAAAVYLLLPRPRAFPTWWGYGSALLSLMLLVALLVRPGSVAPEPILFYSFSVLAILGGGLLITQRNPARAALAFTLVVLSSCGLFLLLAAPFLTAATIIIYAGAIIVTFLFVLMLAQQEGPSNADQRSREPLLATIAGFALLGVLLFFLHQNYGTDELDELIQRARAAADMNSADEIESAIAKSPVPDGNLFKDFRRVIVLGGRSTDLHDLGDAVVDLEFNEWQQARMDKNVGKMRAALVKLQTIGEEATSVYGQAQPHGYRRLSEFSGPASAQPRDAIRRDNGVPRLPADNTAYLGRSLFTDYLLSVEVGGTLLLVATFGAIVIANRLPGRTS